MYVGGWVGWGRATVMRRISLSLSLSRLSPREPCERLLHLRFRHVEKPPRSFKVDRQFDLGLSWRRNRLIRATRSGSDPPAIAGCHPPATRRPGQWHTGHAASIATAILRQSALAGNSGRWRVEEEGAGGVISAASHGPCLLSSFSPPSFH